MEIHFFHHLSKGYTSTPRMHKTHIFWLKYSLFPLAVACTVLGATSSALAASSAAQNPSAVVQFASESRLAGQGTMRFFGLRIYDAALWVQSGFEPREFGSHWLALELTYHRAFQGQAIAERSVAEIARQRSMEPALAQRWTALLTQWLPNVKEGDRLTGVYRPGQGMQLWLGEKDLGVLDDPDLARYFFGIWLSPYTSEPKLRDALLANLDKSTP